ncbi:hypothetical protein ABW19_dt0210096 [Dactylella cylindrospora]|nr:hypothetical protein ABW19_dt0210096 [Dactylella cylindrospora]
MPRTETSVSPPSSNTTGFGKENNPSRASYERNSQSSPSPSSSSISHGSCSKYLPSLRSKDTSSYLTNHFTSPDWCLSADSSDNRNNARFPFLPIDIKREAIETALAEHFRVEYTTNSHVCHKLVYLQTPRSIATIGNFTNAVTVLQEYALHAAHILEEQDIASEKAREAYNELVDVQKKCHRVGAEKFHPWLRRVKSMVKRVEDIGGEVWRITEAGRLESTRQMVMKWLMGHPEVYLATDGRDVIQGGRGDVARIGDATHPLIERAGVGETPVGIWIPGTGFIMQYV